MEKIKITQKGNEVLRKIAKEIPLENIKSKEIKNLIKKMKQAIVEINEAVAIAAPQVGKSLRLFVVSGYTLNPPKSEDEKKEKKDYGYLVFINPKILKKSRGQKIMTEGCLSAKKV